MPQFIRYANENGIARITLSKPPLNILDIAIMSEINEVLKELRENTDTKLIVFDAEGKAFSAGVSVEEHQPETVVEMLNEFHGMSHHLHYISIPSLALVQGAALGGGCELALFCDMVYASETATFGQPEVKLGFFAPVAAIILPQLVGRNRALELMLTGGIISAQKAAQIGMINEAFPAGDFEEQSEKIISRFSKLSASTLRFNREAVDQALYLHFDQAIRHIEDMFLNKLMITEDTREGLASFIEKRKPVWKNR